MFATSHRTSDTPDPTQAPVARSRLPEHPNVGTGTMSVYRSGTLNVQRSTLNFQRGDRKGACWSEYGDRHDMWWPADAARAPGSG